MKYLYKTLRKNVFAEETFCQVNAVLFLYNGAYDGIATF
jgi:hypothetical protein